MRKYIIITITLLFAFKIQAQNVQADKKAIVLNKEIFNYIKKYSLFTKTLNWKNINTESKALVFKGNDSINDQIIYNFYTKKLREAGDKHSFFITSKTINKKTK